jgi:5-methylcytosine-specific restriction endonuclease McrA
VSQKLCACGLDYYDDGVYSSCYTCFQERRDGYLECIFCGRWHGPRFATCYLCRAVHGRDDAGRELRLEILMRDGFTCKYCGETSDLHVDHIKPCSAGGTADQWNLHVLCRKCNLNKGSDWWYGSRHDHARVRLMHLYFTLGWQFLNEEERANLRDEATRYGSEFQFHCKSIGYEERRRRTDPDWDAWLIDYESRQPPETSSKGAA